MTLAAHSAGDASPEHPDPTPADLRPVDRELVSTEAVTAAQALLGALLVHDDENGRRVGRIVETEAYTGPLDKASHARAGKTPRTAVMFGPAGHAYVYLVYGMHHCLNVVCGPDGEAAAVLIRALEPVEGLAQMRRSRGRTSGPAERTAAGPARACEALDVDRSFSGLDLLSDPRLWLAADPDERAAPAGIVAGPRIGVDYAGPDWATRPWRFGVAGSPSLSRPFPAVS